MAGNVVQGGGDSGEHPRLGHLLRVAWIALLVILVLLVFAPKAGGTRELMASAAAITE
jgi:hypothetical protein